MTPNRQFRVMRATMPDLAWPVARDEPTRELIRRRVVLSEMLGGPAALPLAAALLLAAALIVMLPAEFGVDSWLELTAGRLIWQTGIPHHETLTAMALGRPWVDQQWLAQLASYAIYRLGGLGLLGVVNVSLLVSGLVLAARTARKQDAPIVNVLGLLILCSWLLLPATEVRTQAYAIPLFAIVVDLLAADSRAPSRRVYLTLPILLLWANLHGTVTLGCALVMLRGTTLAWERRAQLMASPRAAVGPLTLLLGAPLTLFATPYGLRMLAYYRSTLGSSALRHTVTEWQPVTSSPILFVPVLILIAIMIWAFVRTRAHTWDMIALLVLAAASIAVMRNVPFFALCALAMLPAAMKHGMNEMSPPIDSLRRRVNVLVVVAAALITATAAITAIDRRALAFDGSRSELKMLATVEATMRANPDLEALADSRFTDLMLWRAPWLAGRLADDVRYELYTAAEVTRVQNVFTGTGRHWQDGARGFGLVVLDRSADRQGVALLTRERGSRVLYADRESVVILRSSAPATHA
ncbi:MAG TPA: hypothetical protein VKU84_03110 [Stellaceae bacterium]|nr:hypothetical protein [Stellaceae bacterium]